MPYNRCGVVEPAEWRPAPYDIQAAEGVIVSYTTNGGWIRNANVFLS